MKRERIPWSFGPVPAWRSLDQFAVLWGLSRSRATLAIEALVRDGRMEVRKIGPEAANRTEYRITAE